MSACDAFRAWSAISTWVACPRRTQRVSPASWRVRERHGNDDNRLLDDMCIVLDSLHAAYLDPPDTSGEGPCA
jgi:hypothetical protein